MKVSLSVQSPPHQEQPKTIIISIMMMPWDVPDDGRREQIKKILMLTKQENMQRGVKTTGFGVFSFQKINDSFVSLWNSEEEHRC